MYIKKAIKKYYQFFTKSVTNKLISVFMIVIIIPFFIISLISFKSVEKIVVEKVNLSTQGTLEKTALSIEAILDNMIYASEIISLNKNIEAIMSSENTNDRQQDWEEFSMIDNVFVFINSTILPNQTYFSLVGTNGKEFASWPKTVENLNVLTNSEWYDTLDDNQLLWIPAADNYVYEDREQFPKLFTLSRKLYHYMGGDVYAVCTISITHLEVLKLLERSATFAESSLYFIDQNGDPFVSCGDKKLEDIQELIPKLNSEGVSFKHAIEGNEYLVNQCNLNRNSWKIVELIPYSSILDEIEEVKMIQYFWLFTCLLLFLVVSMIVAISFTKPIKSLNNAMKRVENGDLSVSVNVSSQDEIGLLAHGFNSMVEKINDLISTLYDQQKIERELEIQALQAQIRPHFLFNTLNSIRWIAITSGAENAGDMIGMLNSLLKASLRPEKFIRIEDELDNIRNYAYIQKIRFNSSFDIKFEMDQDILKLYTLKFILQPIVENSILHGIDKQRYDGIIHITGEKNEECVILRVWDNGKGINPESLKELKLSLESENSESKEDFGIGLCNLNLRIKLGFGNQYGLNILSEENKWTKVEVCFPYIDQADV